MKSLRGRINTRTMIRFLKNLLRSKSGGEFSDINLLASIRVRDKYNRITIYRVDCEYADGKLERIEYSERSAAYYLYFKDSELGCAKKLTMCENSPLYESINILELPLYKPR